MRKVDQPSTQWAMSGACSYGNEWRIEHEGGGQSLASIMLETAFTTVRASCPHSPLCARLVNLMHTCLLDNFVANTMQRRVLHIIAQVHLDVREAKANASLLGGKSACQVCAMGSDGALELLHK